MSGCADAFRVAPADFLADGAVTSGMLVLEGNVLPLLEITLSASATGMNLHSKAPFRQAFCRLESVTASCCERRSKATWKLQDRQEQRSGGKFYLGLKEVRMPSGHSRLCKACLAASAASRVSKTTYALSLTLDIQKCLSSPAADIILSGPHYYAPWNFNESLECILYTQCLSVERCLGQTVACIEAEKRS